MKEVDITIEVCGMSGDGTIAAGGLINEALSRIGFSILAFDSYPAEIRGFGRCVTRSRVGTDEILALSDETHVLISLDDEQSLSRIPFLAKGCAIFFDNHPATLISEDKSLPAHIEPDADLYGMPFSDLTASATGTTRGRNLAALGGFAAVFGLPPDPFREAIRRKFAPKGKKVQEPNVKSFDAGFVHAREVFHDRLLSLPAHETDQGSGDKVLLSGNVAIAQGALDAGLQLYFGYPITPATPIMEYLAAALPKRGGRLLQMEDEISSIGAVMGSFYAGKRAMTATSGPGFALMTELITHGVMAEIPAVIIDAQRAGPSTGLPTKTEQSDLHAAVYGGPGDCPRIVIAPTNVSECYSYTVKSFQLAERYQTPVIVLTDFFLDNRVENILPPEATAEERADGNLYPDVGARGKYARYTVTDSGISPRSLPGMEGYLSTATGLEHTEKGSPDYSPDNHMNMSRKRHRKIFSALRDLPRPVETSGGGALDVGIIAWGSTYGAALEAVLKLRSKGVKAGALKLTSLFPYHAAVIRDFMNRSKEILIPELNYEGQLADLIGHLHHKDVVRLNKATGVPLTAKAIMEEAG